MILFLPLRADQSMSYHETNETHQHKCGFDNPILERKSTYTQKWKLPCKHQVAEQVPKAKLHDQQPHMMSLLWDCTTADFREVIGGLIELKIELKISAKHTKLARLKPFLWQASFVCAVWESLETHPNIQLPYLLSKLVQTTKNPSCDCADLL